MDEDIDLRRGNIEEPFGFHHLESLVDQSGGIDGDLLPHSPGGVFEGVFRAYVPEALCRPAPERTAGGCEPDFVYAVSRLAVQGLEDGAVLAVNGEDRNAL